jgi:ketosteroid isomerase-like protein
MTFRETLRKHLQAIQDRDLKALADTVAEDSLVLIMADGKLARSTAEFLEAQYFRNRTGGGSWCRIRIRPSSR